jgi:benzoyl-CoA reductase subunit B
MSDRYAYQGLGRTLQKELLLGWYERIASAPQTGTKLAYTFVPGNVAELLRAFGFELVFPEINSLQAGIKKSSDRLISIAEDCGYSSDVCGYVKTDVGMVLSGGCGPIGLPLPKPDLLLCSFTGCTTFIKWFEALAELHGVPLVMLDVPYLREGESIRPEDRTYVVRQLEELVSVCEAVTGVRYDPDRLREILRRSAEAEELWVQILLSARNRPSPFDAYFEAVFFMAPIYALRGLPECVDYYRRVKLEIEERLAFRLGPVPEEKFRVVFEGPPPWPHFRAFWELFKKWGAVSVASSYSKVGGFWDEGFRHDPSRPLESIAEYCILCYTNQHLGMRADLLRRYARRFEADAIVIHSVKSCRSFSMGQADLREAFIKEDGLPTLLVESDLVDPRYFQEAQLRNRVDAFFESLEHRRIVGAAGGAA